MNTSNVDTPSARMNGRLFFWSLMTIALSVASGRAKADSEGDVSAQCSALNIADLSTLQDAPTQITAVRWVQAKEALPTYCQVQGYVAPQVGFEIRLPATNWNRKFLMAGCGGYCGAVYAGACDAPLRKGYACIVTDMGHKSRSAADGLWAYNNLQAEIDFGYRATHVATLAGKAITQRHFQAAPERSYFMGCSTGGRQGLVEAQRFPWDFDGIIAGDPSFIDYSIGFFYALEVANALAGRDGESVLPLPARELLHEAALARCDLDDGVKDGIIGNPSACPFDPAELACQSGNAVRCLTTLQIAAAKKVYAGARTPAGDRLYPGVAIGSELQWAGFPGMKEHFMTAFRYLRFIPDPGPSWTAADFDPSHDYKRFGMMDSLSSASNPDLRRFKAAGAKLIVYSGWNDQLVTPGSVIDHYETVERTMGGRHATQDFFRLFMIPGMNHCAGGDGADTIDFLSALEAWAERGEAPQKLLSSKAAAPDSSRAGFTRPVYPYPQRARYTGRGDSNAAENFRPTEPDHPVATRAR